MEVRGKAEHDATQPSAPPLRPELEPVESAPKSELLQEAARLLPPRFQPEAVIGRGGMGTVFRAKDTALGRAVAVKVLSQSGRADPVVRARFAREARSAAALRHPNIVTVFDSDPDGAFMVMELVEGESLRERLRRDKRLPTAEVRAIGRAVLAGLGAAHQSQIVHRDVKPANILIEPGGGVKLADFGVAWSQDSQLTGTGGYVGTPAYMAPEQLRGRVIDGRADIYSVGVTLFELAAGTKLHTDHRSIENPYQHLLNETGDVALAVAIARAVDEKPEERFPTAESFAEALRREDGGITGETAARGHEEQGRVTFAAPLSLPAHDLSVQVQSGSARGSRLLIAVTGLSLILAVIALGAALFAQRSRNVAADELAAIDRGKIAFLPFEDVTGLPELDFSREGLPHLLGIELEQVDGLRPIGFYRISSRVGNSQASEAEWASAARKLGAAWLVRGKVARSPGGVRVSMNVVPADTPDDEGRRFAFDCSPSEVPERVRSFAGEIAQTVLGRPVRLASRGYQFDFDRQYLLGIAKLEQHQLPEALTALSAAVTINPSSGDAYYYLAVTAWWHERPKPETLAYIQRALDLHPSSVRQAFLEGLRLFVDRRFVDAREYFDRALQQYPEDRDIIYGAFESLYHTGHPREAAETYLRLIAMYPSFRLGSLHLLTYSLAQGSPERIETALRQVRADDDDFWAVWRPKGLMSQRKIKEAIPPLRDLTEKYGVGDTGVSALNTLAMAYATTNQLDLALAITGRLETPSAVSQITRYGYEIARGADVSLLRRQIEAALSEVEPGPRYNWLWTFVVIEVPWESRARRLVRAKTIQPAIRSEQTEDPGVRMLGALIGAHAGELSLIEPALGSWYPELAEVAQASKLFVSRRYAEAAEHFEAAPEQSGDGRWVVNEWFLAAQARRLAHQHDAVIKDCAELIEPRVFSTAWGGAVGPCLVYTAQAQRALGQAGEAEATVQRLRRLRTGAPEGDPLIAEAERGSAP